MRCWYQRQFTGAPSRQRSGTGRARTTKRKAHITSSTPIVSSTLRCRRIGIWKECAGCMRSRSDTTSRPPTRRCRSPHSSRASTRSGGGLMDALSRTGRCSCGSRETSKVRRLSRSSTLWRRATSFRTANSLPHSTEAVGAAIARAPAPGIARLNRGAKAPPTFSAYAVMADSFSRSCRSAA